MKVLVQSMCGSVYETLESKSELTPDKIIGVLQESNLVKKIPDTNEWFENLKLDIAVYMPQHFNCTLRPIFN